MEKIKAVKQEEDCNFKLKGIFLNHLPMFSTNTWSHLLYGFCHCPMLETNTPSCGGSIGHHPWVKN
jgi:hypothetical protein